jgi:hypothetical protein
MLTCKEMATNPEKLFVDTALNTLVGTSDGTVYYAETLTGISRLLHGSTTPEVVINDMFAFVPMPVGSAFYYENGTALLQASLATLPATGTKIADITTDDAGALTNDDAAFYLTHSATHSLVRYPFDGSASTVLATDVSKDPQQIAVFGGYAYYSGPAGALQRVAITGGAAPTVLDPKANPLMGVATDGKVVVYTKDATSHDDTAYLVRIDLENPSDRKAIPVADTPGLIMGRVAFDSGHFYVAATNTILRVNPDLTTCDIVGDEGTSDFAITDKYIYYRREDNTLVRAPK